MNIRQGLLFPLALLMTVTVHAADPDPTQLPQYAEDCWHQITPNCSLIDTECFCADKPNHISLITCAESNCTTKEYFITRRLNEKQCGIPKRKGVDAVNGSELTTFILATTFFLARIMAKSMRLGGNWGMDDYTIMVAWARHPKQLDLLAAAVEIACIKNGFGKNIWDIPFDHITKFYKYFNAFATIYKVQISLAKISVCLFLLRIFQSRTFRCLAYTLIGVNTAIGFIWALVDPLRCLPVHLTWDGWMNEHPEKCIDFDTAVLMNCLVNIVIDSVIVIMPVYEVSKLQLPLQKKISVGLMFMMGSVLTIIAIIRVAVFQRDKLEGNETATAGLQPLMHWSAVECLIAVMCACLPASRALFIHFFPNLGQSFPRRQYVTPPNTAYSKGQPSSKIIKSVSYSVDHGTRSGVHNSMNSFVPLVEQDRNC